MKAGWLKSSPESMMAILIPAPVAIVPSGLVRAARSCKTSPTLSSAKSRSRLGSILSTPAISPSASVCRALARMNIAFSTFCTAPITSAPPASKASMTGSWAVATARASAAKSLAATRWPGLRSIPRRASNRSPEAGESSRTV